MTTSLMTSSLFVFRPRSRRSTSEEICTFGGYSIFWDWERNRAEVACRPGIIFRGTSLKVTI